MVMVEYSIEDFFRWLQSIKKEFEDDVNRLSKENEQLQQRNQELNDTLQDAMGEIGLLNGLKEENEQLRQQLKTICNTCCYDCEEQWCEK